MTARTIAIGDIHGCARALDVLLAALDPQPADTLITLGDYVDRGPNSRAVLDQLVALIDRCVLIPLRGNHEILLLDSLIDAAAFKFWLECGGVATLDSYGGDLKNIPPEHLVFLQGLRPFYETETHMYLHANYDADLPLAETPDMLLYWEHVCTRMPRPHRSGKTAIVGHTPQASGNILDLGFLKCIDTYCFGGGWLTALDVGSGKIWQTNEDSELREA